MSAIAQDVRLEQLRIDADRCGPEARALFERLLSEGKTPEAAAMYACQQAPGTRFSDRAFCQGQQRKMETMPPLVRNMLQSQAKEAGIDTRGKFYIGGLAKKGKGARDPAAWVTSAEDVLTVAKKRNLTIEGVLNQKASNPDTPPPATVPLAPDIVRTLAKKALQADPALRERCRKNPHARRELAESIVQKHTRRKRTRKSNRLLSHRE